MGQYFSNEKLPSKVKKTTCNILNHSFTFLTDNGVFSKDGVDFGSRLLLESIPLKEVGAKVLDVGCGYGTLGIVVSKLTGAKVDMVDVNLRAIHLANRNIKENDCINALAYESNCYSEVSGLYNTIITNPPIRAGKKIVYDIVLNAVNYLDVSGKLFLVIRKEQGAKSLINDIKDVYDVTVLERSKGFYILECVKKIIR